MSDVELRRGAQVTLAITSVALDGRGVGELAGRPVHVTGALPPERVIARIDAVDRQGGRVHATSQRLLPGPGSRRHVPCPRHAARTHHGCTGCPWMPWTPAQQRDALRVLLAGAGLAVERVVHADEAPVGQSTDEAGAQGYRWSAKRVAFMQRGLRLGSFRARSHQGADMAGCLVDHPRITAAADQVAAMARALDMRAFEPERGHRPPRPGLRYVWLKTDGESVLVTLITAGLSQHEVTPLAKRLTEAAGVAWSTHEGSGNAIRGAPPVQLAGVPTLTLSLAGEPVDVGPLGFLQPNPAIAARCYDTLVRDEDGAALEGARALDLYAGAGVTTRLLRRHFVSVTPCESWPESAALLGVAPQTAVEALAAQLAGDAPAPDLVVANPPRAGLGAQVCQQLSALRPPRLHIMSCSPRSLRSDLDMLGDTFELVDLQAFATLPQTPHVELVAKLKRAAEPG